MVVSMMRAYWKDIWRSVAKGKKRFISIALIAALGVTMMCGLRASCEDLRYSADRFFDEQHLFDIRILSTLGLTDEDVEALERLDGVLTAEGGFSETVYTKVSDQQKSIEIRTLSEKEFNQPYILEGRLPVREDEIVITENYKNQSGKGLGDRILLDEKPEYLTSEEYTITGIVIDTMDINSSEGAMGFRSTTTSDYVGYVTPEAVDADFYTVVYLSLQDTEELLCYSDDYEQNVQQVVDEIESGIQSQREQARYNEVYDEAMEEWLDGEREMKEEFAKADQEIADAEKEIADGKLELADAREELENARKELADGRQKLADGEAELNLQEEQANAQFASARNEIQNGYDNIISGEQELEASYNTLVESQRQLEAGKAELETRESEVGKQFEEARQTLDAQEAQLEETYHTYEEQYHETVVSLQSQIDLINEMLADTEISEEQKGYLQETLEELQQQLATAEESFAAVQQQIAEGKETIERQKAEIDAQETAVRGQFDEEWAKIKAGQKEIDSGWEQYNEGVRSMESGRAELEAGEASLNQQEESARSQIAAGRAELEAGKQELMDGERELADGEQKMADGEQELADGERELAENKKEYREEKAKAERELADAKEEINDIDMARWYVQDRSTLSGYANIESDADSIQAIGDIFPVLFLTVAILISLTTITRMVEEERGLIGTYKALGFTNREIRRKYMIYAAAACLIGGLLGDIGGYVILPAILFIIFRVMYVLPDYAYQFDLLYGLGGILLFEAGVLAAVVYTCRRTLSKMPARLMRPKSPKAGSRVLLERFTFIWKHLSFLNKVTARNLFRYKKRLLMTVFGIMGCTALLLCGFTIKNTISEMMPQQYQNIYRYDLMAVSGDDEFDNLKDTMERDREIADYISARIETVEVFNDAGTKESIQIIAAAQGDTLDSYICLKNDEEQEYHLEDGEIYITKNASRILSFSEGDIITLRNQELVEAEVTVDRIVENYLGNMIYMTEATYREVFGDYVVNGILANFSENCSDPSTYTDTLARREGILTAVSTQKMEAEFKPAFQLINMVVYVVLILAALLAFVVLFTLSNTNISERERELATIKVLGFYNREVHSYVDKETLILTGIGILCGMPAGLALGRYVMGILEFPSLEFYITLYPESYLIAGVITLVFALIVNMITDRTLDRINMVEALKSVE